MRVHTVGTMRVESCVIPGRIFAFPRAACVLLNFSPAGDAAAGHPRGAPERGGGQGFRSVQLHKSAGRQLYARGVQAVGPNGRVCSRVLSTCCRVYNFVASLD